MWQSSKEEKSVDLQNKFGNAAVTENFSINAK